MKKLRRYIASKVLHKEDRTFIAYAVDTYIQTCDRRNVTRDYTEHVDTVALRNIYRLFR